MAELELYYVTNRGHEGKDRWSPERYGTKFSQDGIENLRFGKVAVAASTSRTDKFLKKRRKSASCDRDSSLPRLFDHIFMCSPDVDDNVMESGEPMYKLHQLARELTIYANRGDKAMVISDYTKGQPERLGGAGAARPSLLHAKVHQVDCTDIASGMIQHSYYQDGLTNADIRQSIDGIAPGAGPRKRKKVGRLDNVWAMGNGQGLERP